MKQKGAFYIGMMLFGIFNYMLSIVGFLVWDKFADAVLNYEFVKEYDLLVFTAIYFAIILVTGPIYSLIALALPTLAEFKLVSGKEKVPNESSN